MTPKEFKSARHALGLSAQGLANALGVKSGRTIRRWEAGQNDIPIMAIQLIRTGLKEGVPLK
jgi:DNA-binding transcriptional regulator YiaG